jgi:hypothetical protein
MQEEFAPRFAARGLALADDFANTKEPRRNNFPIREVYLLVAYDSDRVVGRGVMRKHTIGIVCHEDAIAHRVD